MFYTCTTYDANDGEVWCGTTVEYTGNWGYCTYGKKYSISDEMCDYIGGVHNE